MRTLIIDNYDSFTYNLVHQVGGITGTTPVVIRNDEPNWTLDGFDNIIVSPGPGRPERPGDFGICAEVIRRATVPLLGVCLGHQGICHVHGGEVAAAPRVRHGQTSPVFHDGVDILAGLPSPFDAVRYHSLIATRLPDVLEPIAMADDGVLMALRHRHRPQWGVQFHPESICTDHGHRLLENFLTERAARPSYRVRELPTPRIRHRRIDTTATAEAVFDAVYAGSAYAFWLDSADSGRSGGRFSFLGDAGGPRARVATADVTTGRVTVRRADQPDEVITGRFLDWLDADLAANRMAAPDLPFDFTLGWVGYLGYELKAECGSPNSHHADHPDAALVFADRAIAFDHQKHQVHALAMPGDEQWLDDIEATLLALADPTEPIIEPEVGPLRARHDRAAYLDLIDACQQEITAGETYEVCLTNTLTADGKLDPWSGYRRLRRANPEPFSALLRFGELSVLSASPERFLTVSAAGIAESKPIKGTRPRGATPAEDERLRRDLVTSAKDRAENLMIVDLVRNDLGSCAELDSVTVDRLFDVETFATVHQLVSTVRARLRPDRTAIDCVRAAFPGGSMTGAPKLRTMEIIDRLEAGPRGVYSGALGYFSLSGAVDLSIVIRTLVVEPDRVSYGVGGAIIALSDPAEEFAETEVKAAPLLRLLGAEFPTTGDGTPP